MTDGGENYGNMSRNKVVAATVVLLCFCSIAPLVAEEWYLPNGQTITTQAGSTPPMSDARREPYPKAEQPQNQAGESPYPAIVTAAPSVAQLSGLLPQENGATIKTSQYFSDAKVGQPGGQCAAFAQKAREDLLRYAPYGSANKMPDMARENGFEVNGIPRVGSVLIVAKPTGSTDGHAEVVTSVMRTGERYILTIMDSNANKDEIISARTIFYTPSENGTFGNYGKYEEASPGLTKLAPDLIVMGFIQEKKADETE